MNLFTWIVKILENIDSRGIEESSKKEVVVNPINVLKEVGAKEFYKNSRKKFDEIRINS